MRECSKLSQVAQCKATSTRSTRTNQLEDKIVIKVNYKEFDQLREEIETAREGQLQAMEEKQKKLKERIVMK